MTGTEVREWRERLGVSREAVSLRLGLGVEWLTQREADQQPPKYDRNIEGVFRRIEYERRAPTSRHYISDDLRRAMLDVAARLDAAHASCLRDHDGIFEAPWPVQELAREWSSIADDLRAAADPNRPDPEPAPISLDD
jgi:transcriptional regulator with XRE-family HTH domain